MAKSQEQEKGTNEPSLHCEPCDLDVFIEQGLCGSSKVRLTRHGHSVETVVGLDERDEGMNDLTYGAKLQFVLDKKCDSVGLSNAIRQKLREIRDQS